MATVRINYAAIVSDVEAGMARGEIARRNNCSESHVSRIYSAYRAAKEGNQAYLIRLRHRAASVADFAEQFLPVKSPEPPAGGDSAFDRVIAMLRTEYRRALNDKYIRSPLAYALYQVWKEVDTHGEEI